MVTAELPEVSISTPPRPFISEGQASQAELPAIRRVPDTHGALEQLPTDWDRVDTLAALPDLRLWDSCMTALSLPRGEMAYGLSISM